MVIPNKIDFEVQEFQHFLKILCERLDLSSAHACRVVTMVTW